MINNIKDKKILDFMIIKKSNNRKIGTIALNKITKSNAEWGRWISKGNIVENIESVIILLDYGFNNLRLRNIYSLTNNMNTRVVNFHKNTTALFKKQENHFFDK